MGAAMPFPIMTMQTLQLCRGLAAGKRAKSYDKVGCESTGEDGRDVDRVEGAKWIKRDGIIPAMKFNFG